MSQGQPRWENFGIKNHVSFQLLLEHKLSGLKQHRCIYSSED